jgi:hypothetical protein
MSKFVTIKSNNVSRSFYIVVNDNFLASGGDHCVDLFAGDIFLITSFNKIGYWWGVSVYDLDRQGWIPSSLVQPYTGEVPEEASELKRRLAHNFNQVDASKVSKSEDKEPSSRTSSSLGEFNIVTDDANKYQEYDSVAVISREGKRVIVGDSDQPVDVFDKEDFDYETWAESKREAAAAAGVKRSRIK